jgi:glycosyltransferase involved in cell wall biosynthesis
MRLSIIISVYNVRMWLERCVASCKNQGLNVEDYELVIVNDGSTDDSAAVIDALMQQEAEQDAPSTQWVVVNQLNQGLSAARNAGLAAAHGDYVWWVDGDDFVEPNSIVSLLQRAEAEQLDAICFGVNLYMEGEKPKVERVRIEDKTGGKTVDGPTFLLQTDMPPAAWAAIYRREFLAEHGLQFLVGALHEDQEFTPRAYFFAKKIAFSPAPVYNYVQREGSIMNSLNPKKTDDMLAICDRLWRFSEEHTEAGTPMRMFFLNRISFLFSQALSNLCKCGIFEFPGDCKALPYYPLSINKLLTQKQRYKYRLINVGVPLYMSLYRKFNGTKPGRSRRLRTH